MLPTSPKPIHIPTDDKPIQLNGAIYVFCGILKFVVTSAAEAELGALFSNCKEGNILRLQYCKILATINHRHLYIVTMLLHQVLQMML
jgi:hypothetical protein